MFIKIAVKSAIMHKKRSLVIIIACAIAVGLLTLISSLIQGVVQGFFENAVNETGQVRIRSIEAKSSLDPYSLKLLFEDKQELWSQVDQGLAKNGLEGISHESVLTTGGLLVEPVDDMDQKSKNTPVILHGVNQETKSAQKAQSNMVEGSFLPHERSIVVSQSVVKMLRLKLGGIVQVLVKDTTGSPQYLEFTVDGVFKSENKLYDDTNAFMLKSQLQDLLLAPNQVNEVRFMANKEQMNQVNALVEAYQPAFDAASNKGLEIQGWAEIHKSILSLLAIVQSATWIIRFIFIIVAASIITNTILMSVFERTREYGTLRAIGLKKRKQTGMILLESALLGFLGSIVGLTLGGLAVLGMSQGGIDLGGTMETFGLNRLAKPSIDLVTVLISLITGIVVALISSMYAARVIGKKSVVESLTTI